MVTRTERVLKMIVSPSFEVCSVSTPLLGKQSLNKWFGVNITDFCVKEETEGSCV